MKDRSGMTCREAIDFILDYLDGALPAVARTEFERHLAACPSCVAYLEGYRRTVAMGKVAFAQSEALAGEALPDGLVRAICAAKEKGRSG